MPRLNSLELDVRECTAIHSEADVVRVVEALRPLGVVLALGAWTFDGTPRPAEDVVQKLAQGHLDWHEIWLGAKERPRDRLKHTERWGSGLLRIDQPHTFATVEITRRGWTDWDILIGITADRLRQAGLTVDEFAASWASLLEDLGDVLYDQVRPAIALVYGTRYDIPDFSRPVLNREIGAGWRTWFGPTYVERYSRDWLRGLPDRTRDLADGGIGHALEQPLVELVSGMPEVYASLWSYFDETGRTPFWPRRRRRGVSRAGKRSEKQRNGA